MKESIQEIDTHAPSEEIDTHAPSEVSIDPDCQGALPLLPRRLITDTDQAKAWALAFGDY